MITRKECISVAVMGILLVLGSLSTSRTLTPLWHFKIEDMTDFAMSANGEYIIVACEKGPLCNEGQYYVFDRYGNTVDYGCIESEITTVDIADNGAFFIGTRNGYYFHTSSEKIQKDLDMGIIFQSVSISENGEIVAAGTDEEVLIFDDQGILNRKEVGRPAKFAEASASGNIVAAGTSDEILLYRESSDTWIELTATGTISALAVSDDGSTVACGMTTSMIWILNSQLREKETFMAKGGIDSIALSADGNFLVCGTRKGELCYLYSTGDEKWSSDVENIVRNISISSDGNLIAVLSGDVILFDSSGKKIQELKSSETIQNMYLSKTGEILSYISGEELVFIELYEKSLVRNYEYKIPSRKSIPLDDELIETWSYEETPYSVIAADVNGDGQSEIICSLARDIAVLTPEGKPLWKKSFAFQPGFNVMDVTGDFVPEIIISSGDNRMGVQVLDGKGQELARHEFYSRWYSVPPPQEIDVVMWSSWSGDIDSDGLIEVVCVVSSGFNLEPRGLYAFEYPSFKEEWYYPMADIPEKINFVDIDGDGEVEIVSGSNAPCNGRLVRGTDDCHAYIYAVTLEGKELWIKQIGTEGYKRVHIAVADLDGDGNQEIVGAGWSFENNWGALFVVDPEGNYITGKGNEFDYSVFLEAVADLDDDGDMEIIVSSSPSTLVLYDHELREIRRKDVLGETGKTPTEKLTNVTINDFDADDEKEIILTSEDKKLLILNTNLEEEWSKVFPSYIDCLKTAVVSLHRCKNYLLVLSDKLYAYTYSDSPDWPCIPWAIAEQQKKAEAESYIENGNKCLEKEDCECARAEFTHARNNYGQIKNQEGIAEADGKMQLVETCLTAQESLAKAKEYFEEENRSMAEKYLLEAKETYKLMENHGRLEEIQQYFEKIEDIKKAEVYFDGGREQIRIGKIEEGIEKLERTRDIYRSYGWEYHVQLVEVEINEATEMLPNWLDTMVGVANVIIGVVTIVIGIVSNFIGEKKSLVYQEKPALPQKEDVRLIPGAKDVENLDLLRIKFINNGNEKIEEDDFRERIVLRFNSQAKVWKVSVKDRNPRNIQVPIYYQMGSNIVKAEAYVVGPGEWFTLDFYVEDYEGYDIDANIIGIKEVNGYGPHRFLYNMSVGLFLCGMAALVPIVIAEVLRLTDVFSSKMPLLLITFALMVLEFTFLKGDWFNIKYDS